MPKPYYAVIKFCLALLVVAGFISGCKQKPVAASMPSDYSLRKFWLQDSLAFIQIYIPNELDTFYEWVHVSDDVCDDYHLYRFANKTYPTIAETGFYWERPDSAYQLSVYHIDKYYCTHSSPLLDSGQLAIRIAHVINKYKDQGDSILSINGEVADYNGQRFIVIGFTALESYPKQRRASYLTAVTFIDSNFLAFNYTNSGSGCPDFINRMNVSLASIKITTKQTAVDLTK
jgi:hypothetical protein